MFKDRFTYNNPALEALNLTTSTETQIAAVSPLLMEMVGMVKQHSVLLTKKSVQVIYEAIVNIADPRIALILAAARDKAGVQLFPDSNIVREFMYGIKSTTKTSASVDFNERTIFQEGIMRVSAALAASYLIAQLSQLPEQADHAKVLEKQALEDLDRILKVPDLTRSVKEDYSLPEVVAFWFKDTSFQLPTKYNLVVSVYLSSLSASGWIEVGQYTGIIQTGTIAVDIAQTINSHTLVNNISNVIAAPILAGGTNLHRIEFSARYRDAAFSSEVISAQLQIQDVNCNLIDLPFDWGVEKTVLNNRSVNSLLLSVNKGTLTAVPGLKDSLDKFELNVIYIRKKQGYEDVIPTRSTLTFRVSPTMDYAVSTSMVLDDTLYRPSQLGLLMLDELFKLKVDRAGAKLLGSIIRNDPLTLSNPLVGVQMVAWTVTNPQVSIIYDLIDIPPDLETALGTIEAPVTAFSDKPKSVKVTCRYERGIIDEGMRDQTLKMVPLPKSKLVQRIHDIKADERIRYNRWLV